jgi:hypothetical protein
MSANFPELGNLKDTRRGFQPRTVGWLSTIQAVAWRERIRGFRLPAKGKSLVKPSPTRDPLNVT